MPLSWIKHHNMMNRWEARERQVKRIALIASVILHLVIIVALTYGGEERNSQEPMDQTKKLPQEQVEADTQV